MNPQIKKALKVAGYPAWLLYKRIKQGYYDRNPMAYTDHLFFSFFQRHIDWNDPKDLNEKINWLKFHEDPQLWARLSDKYRVREYVEERGLSDILVPLYGKYDSPEEVLAAWDSLPEEFVLKSNNGCGHVLIFGEGARDKASEDKEALKELLEDWFKERDFGKEFTELHYQFIANCFLVEKRLKDERVREFSRSMVDYKLWCFNGEPYGCLVVYDRDPVTHRYILDFYDTEWQEHTEWMTDQTTPRKTLPRPENWDRMLEIASVLSSGHPQVRVDLYNINGEIRFGELTFTAATGFMSYFTQDMLQRMGERVKLDMSMPLNELAKP